GQDSGSAPSPGADFGIGKQSERRPLPHCGRSEPSQQAGRSNVRNHRWGSYNEIEAGRVRPRNSHRVVGILARYDAPKNWLGQNNDNTVPDDNVRRKLPNHAALFGSSGLNMPVWGLLRVDDVIR